MNPTRVKPVLEYSAEESLLSPVRAVAAATVGNALEFYDFLTYAFFALQIGRALFPSGSAYGTLMLSLATFGAGFVTRPIGGILIGAYSDRAGRRAGMVLSFTLMGAATAAMALIPPYSRIGPAAPVMAVAVRMVMGFSLGGEVGPATAYLLEAAPGPARDAARARRGRPGDFAGVAQRGHAPRRGAGERADHGAGAPRAGLRHDRHLRRELPDDLRAGHAAHVRHPGLRGGGGEQ